MNKIDLIIEAIRLAEYHVIAKDWGDDIDLELYTEALAAARELRELKPVAFIENHKAGQNLSWSQDDLPYAKATPLYALDEVKHD